MKTGIKVPRINEYIGKSEKERRKKTRENVMMETKQMSVLSDDFLSCWKSNLNLQSSNFSSGLIWWI